MPYPARKLRPDRSARDWFGAELRYWRQRRGLTPQELGDQVFADASTLRKIETAQRTCSTREFAERLDAALSTGGVLARAWELLDGERTRKAQPHDRTGDPHQTPGGFESDMLAYWVEELRRLEADYDIAPSASLLAEAGQLHGAVASFLPEGRDKATKSLHQLHARSALLMGQLVWDASQRRDGATATGFFDEARRASHQGHSHTVAAEALLRRSFIPLYGSGDVRSALASAQRAVSAAQQVPAIKALAQLHVSEAHARLGHSAEAEQSLLAAEQTAERANLDAAEWATRSHRIAGSVYITLHQPSRAQSFLEDAVPRLQGRPKSQALVLANLALAYLQQQHLDATVATLHKALDTIELTHAGGALNIVATTTRELKSWREQSWVTEIHERFLALLAT